MWILCNVCLVVSFTVSANNQNDVRKPPSITKGPETKIIFRENQEVTLTCKAEGTPDVTYGWKRNGEHLNLNHSNISRGSDGDITIREATRKDNGFYQCFARNQYGTALSTVAHIQMAFLYPISKSDVIFNMTVAEGRPFVIQAARRNSIPSLTYYWEIVNSIVAPQLATFNQSQRVRSACNGDLHFAYALKEDELDSNIYKSSVFNAHADIKCCGTFTGVMVTQGSGPPPDFPPNATYFSKSQEIALIGGSINLECFFSGKPLPAITWSRFRNNLPSGRNNISHYATKLTISNISESDEGDYVCTATNTLGRIHYTLNIRVEAAPVFKRESDSPHNVNVTEGESVTFNCFAFAKPEATVVWLLNGQPINANNPPERFVLSNDNESLTIRNVCRDCVDRDSKTDLMVIQCNASNVHGYAFASGYLNVLQRTKVTLLLSSSIERAKENRFQFICSAASDPSTPSTVRWYKVGVQSQQLVFCKSPHVYAMDDNLTIYTEANCSYECDKYLGEYRCVGGNGYSRDTVIVILNGTTANNPSERFVFSNDNKTLTIIDVCRDCVDRERETDLMVIQCNASNVHGYMLNVSNTPCDYEHSIFQPCPCNAIGWCSRKCLPGKGNAKSHWSRPNFNGCFDKEFRELLDKLSLLSCLAHNEEETSQKNHNAEIAEIASQLSILTNKSEGLSPGNLNASVMMINGLADLRNGSEYSPNAKEIKSVMQAASNVLQLSNFKAWKDLEDVYKSVATFILFALEVYGRSLSTLDKLGYIIVEEDSFVLEAWLFNKSNLPLQIEFPSRSVWGENRGHGISISLDATNSSFSSENQSTLNMWGVYYRTIHDYLPGNKDIDFVNSRVLAFSIDGLTTNDTLNPPVLITLRHNQEKRIRFQRTCAFWNFDRGDWDSIGCSVKSTNSTHTICSCNHLTNFAILMSRNPSVDEWLSLISIIGCSISVTALILTIIVYAMTWKHSKSSRATILLNLCVALIIAYIIFMAGGDKYKSEVSCKVVAVLLHYFFLAAFFIMLAEGVEMVLYMFFVFHVRRTRETVMLILSAWFLPLIIVGVSLGSTKLEGYGHETACWLSVETHLIWAFVGPVLCIVTVNFVILILVLRLVSQKKDLLAKDRRKRDEIRATIWNLSVTCPVLGLGWLFGVFSIAFDSVVFEYLFVIANSLQGLIIFIIYALFYNKQMNEKISSVYSNYICHCRITYTQMTSTQEQSTLSRATTQTSSAQEQSTCSIAANDSGEAIPMTPAQQQSTSSRAAIQMTSAEDQSTSSKAPTQMALAQEQSTSSIVATQMASAQDKSTGSIAATQMNLAQEQSAISIAATQMASAQEKSTGSIAATQMNLAEEVSTSSIAATQMASAEDQSTNSIAANDSSEAIPMTPAQQQSTSPRAATQMASAQEKCTGSIGATQMASAQEQCTSSETATQMASAQEQSTSSIAAKKKSHKTGFLGVPTAFKFCEDMGGQHNLKRTGTQLMSIVDSDTFDSAH